MNIVLVPYTWARHLNVALVTGSAALVGWWVLLFFTVVIRPVIGIGFAHWFEGAALLALASGLIAGTSILAEMSLRRLGPLYRFGLPVITALFAGLFTLLMFGVMTLIVRLVTPSSLEALINDQHFASYRFRFLQWAFAGIASGVAPFIIRAILFRKWLIGFDHLGGGLSAGVLGGVVWHFLSYFGIAVPGSKPIVYLIPPDMYLATALALFTWGFLHGLLVWAIPDELYAGWFRVMDGARAGHRIPIDHVTGGPSERFVGHFPRGLDMHLPEEKGVAELHVSFVTDGQGRYAVRGLSQAPTNVKRFLERVDLRYDARRPAPLETELSNEDTVSLGAKGDTVIEFLLLPKEEA